MAVPVAVYTRISDDWRGGGDERGEGVARQRDDCLALASVRRWKASRVYEDNDVSAYKRGVRRPEFEQMLLDLQAGTVRGIVVYNLDRLARQPKDLERLIDVYEDHRGYVFASLEGDIDLVSSDGRTMARVLVAFANKASADTGRRVQRVQRELASQGKIHAGALPYGWQDDKKTVDPAAKAEIDRAHDRILAGDRIDHIRTDWSERKVLPPATGRDLIHWSTIKRLLTNPVLAGLKTYRGEVALDATGQPIRGAWEAICTPERLEMVVAALERHSPGNPAPGSNVVKYLLSGIARCGVCLQPMGGSARRRKGRAYPGYVCNGEGGRGRPCGKVVRSSTPVDEVIIELVLADQRRRKAATPEAPAWQGEAELTAVRAEIDELVAAKRDGQISVSTLIQLVPDLERRRDELLHDKRRTLMEAQRSKALSIRSRDEFDALALDRQRALVLKSLDAVIIHPSGKGNFRFNPDLIEPVWAN